MNKKNRLIVNIRRALKNFDWGDYGYDELEADMDDPDLDIREALAICIYDHLDDPS